MASLFFLTCGFRRTGKDTFYRGLKRVFHRGETQLNEENVNPEGTMTLAKPIVDPEGAVEVHKWAVLANGFGEMVLRDMDRYVIVEAERIAFADILKQEVHERLDLAEHQRDPVWLEANKDTLLFEGKTLRQHYIDTAMAKREEDPTYWAERAMETLHRLPENINNPALPGGPTCWPPVVEPEQPVYWPSREERRKRNESCPPKLGKLHVVTDFRFPNEERTIRKYARYYLGDKVVTCRLFRPEVPVPPADERSERALDQTTTDLLLVPIDRMNEAYAQALKLWPQYADHRFVNIIGIPVC